MAQFALITILIVAPTQALRVGLRALLATDDLRVVGESAALAGPPEVDIVVAADDGLLPGLVRAAGDDARFSVLALTDDDRAAVLLRDAPLAGWGLAPRDTDAAGLQAAVRAVAQGLVVLPPEHARRLVAPRAPGVALAGPPAESLTPREREVLELLSQGLPNKLIAQRLQISEHTVKFHISSIFAKLGASSRTDAISRGARLGLITL
jgi:DNA-binding NarL/FixJ family response regulator